VPRRQGASRACDQPSLSSSIRTRLGLHSGREGRTIDHVLADRRDPSDHRFIGAALRPQRSTPMMKFD